MMGSRPVREPAEFVIWSATALLAMMVGLGAAFTLWAQFHRLVDHTVVYAAVVALGLGLSLIAVAVDNLTARLFIWVASATLLIAFFTCPTLFASLAG